MTRELDLLTGGTIEIAGRMAEGGNATFGVVLTAPDGSDEWFAIYKPLLGERPLHDFEPGLHKRERAAYVLSEHLGWGIVPPTVIREEAPVGPGSLQWYVESDENTHYFTLLDEEDTYPQLRRLAVFDYLANNADRKAGHVLRGPDGHIVGIDHGLCFASELKLRTVIWEFAGERIEPGLLEDLAPLADAVPDEFDELLSGRERASLRRRARALLADPYLPLDFTGGYAYPWPLI